MNTATFLAALSLFLGIAAATNIPVHDCGSKQGKITHIDVTPCTSIPCPFKKGTSINVTVDFTANADVSSATSDVHGIIAGLPVPFPLKDSNACHDMKCPIKSGDKVTYKNSVDVLKSYPSISLIVKWEIKSSGGDLVCFTVPVKIVS